MKAKKINILIEESAENWLIDEGFSESYGARPLKRIIQNNIIDKITDMILRNELNDEKSYYFSRKQRTKV